MADAKTKDTRLVVRLEAEDLAYVREQGEALSLDASTWVRMMIRKLRLGQIGDQLPPLVRVTSTPLMHDPSYTAETLQYGAEQSTFEHSSASSTPVDTDDLVARKMAEADSRGLTQPRAAAEDDDMAEEFAEFTGGIRPVGERKSWKTGSPKDFRPE